MPRALAPARRLPVAARAGTGASVADATFLAGISSRRSIGAAADLGGLGDGVCAACGGEAGAPADEAQQARAYVAWLCRHALNLHTEWPCTLTVTARTPCAPTAPAPHIGEHG